MRWLAVPILVLMALVALAACSGPDDDDDDQGDAATAISSTATATEPAETPQDPTATDEEPATTPTASEPEASPTEKPAATATAGADATVTGDAETEEITLSVYFMRADELAAGHRVIEATPGVGRAAMEALLAGPGDVESEAGLTSAIPEGTELLDLVVEDGIATVDLSEEFESGGGSLSIMARVAQVTFTLTQFPTVDAVRFMIEGQPVEALGGEGLILSEPVDRSGFEDILPAIFVESPAVGDSVESPLRVWGTANTFEATFMLNIVDPEGAIIAEEVVTATSGTGTRGTFDVTVPFETTSSGMGTLVVFELSAKDGSQINIVEIPVLMESE